MFASKSFNKAEFSKYVIPRGKRADGFSRDGRPKGACWEEMTVYRGDLELREVGDGSDDADNPPAGKLLCQNTLKILFNFL